MIARWAPVFERKVLIGLNKVCPVLAITSGAFLNVPLKPKWLRKRAYKRGSLRVRYKPFNELNKPIKTVPRSSFKGDCEGLYKVIEKTF